MGTVPDTKSQLDAIRAGILGKKQEFKSKELDLFGQKVELRQPTLADINRMAKDQGKMSALILTVIEYCYVPGTSQKVFTSADAAALEELPGGAWLSELNEAIESLTGIKVKVAEKNSEETPSDSSPTK